MITTISTVLLSLAFGAFCGVELYKAFKAKKTYKVLETFEKGENLEEAYIAGYRHWLNSIYDPHFDAKEYLTRINSPLKDNQDLRMAFRDGYRVAQSIELLGLTPKTRLQKVSGRLVVLDPSLDEAVFTIGHALFLKNLDLQEIMTEYRKHMRGAKDNAKR